MTLSGIDVSHHQGSIDWAQVAGSGHTWAFAKATEGVSLRDPRFAQNWAGMAAAGLVRGAYHFLSPASDPAAQARAFVNMVGDLHGSLAAVDVETTATGGHPTSTQARAFAVEFRRLTGGHPLILYTGRWYWRDILKNPYGADIGPLWHSAYSGSPGALYGGWDRFTMWQYTSSGVCPGVAGRCDLNHFFGDRAGLLALTGTVAPPPPPEEEADMPLWIVHPIESSSYFLWRDDLLIYLPTTPDIQAADVAGAKHWPVSAEQWAVLTSRYEVVAAPPPAGG